LAKGSKVLRLFKELKFTFAEIFYVNAA